MNGTEIVVATKGVLDVAGKIKDMVCGKKSEPAILTAQQQLNTEVINAVVIIAVVAMIVVASVKYDARPI